MLTLLLFLALAYASPSFGKGPKQANDGHPNTFHAKILAAYPALKP